MTDDPKDRPADAPDRRQGPASDMGQVPIRRTADSERVWAAIRSELKSDKDPDAIPAVLVANHGPFAWGRDAAAAAHNAVVLESIARMAYFTTTLNPQVGAISSALHDRHFLRKHGRNAYYGQAGEKK